MKRLKIFGLLAVIALLAFGLALSCDSSTPADDGGSEPAYVYTYLLDGGRLALQFSQDPDRLRATETGPEEGDSYVLKETAENGATLSFGTVTSVGNTGGSLKTIHLTPDPVAFPEQPAFNAEFSDDGGITVDSGAPVGENGAPSDAPIEGSKDDGTGNPPPAPSNPSQGNQGNQGGNQGTPVQAKYTVTFNSGEGGPVVDPIEITAGSAIGTLPVPRRAGFEFAGWFTASSGGDQVTSSYVPTRSITVYAEWVVDKWLEISSANNELKLMQAAATPDTAAINAEITRIKGLVLEAFKKADIKDWVTVGPLSSVYPQDKVPDEKKTHLYYVASQLTGSPKRIVIGNPPAGVVVTGDGTTLDGTDITQNVVLTYAIGSTGSAGDKVVYNVEFWPIAEYEVIFKEGATGKIVVEDKDPSGNGESVEATTSKTFIAVTGSTGITVTIPAGLQVRAVDDASSPATISADFPIITAQNEEEFLFTAASKRYTITVSVFSYTITFSANVGNTGGAIDLAYIDASPATNEAAYPGFAVGTLPTPPSRGGYTFNGWAANPAGGAAITATSTVQRDTTVYAQWKEVTVKDEAAPWERINSINAVITAMPKTGTVGTRRGNAITALKTDVMNAFDGSYIMNWFTTGSAILNSYSKDNLYNLNDPSNTANYHKATASTVSYYINGAKGQSWGYLDSKVPATRQIPVNTANWPTGVTFSNPNYVLPTVLTDSEGSKTKMDLVYVIGGDATITANVVKYGFTLYPTAKVSVTYAGTGAFWLEDGKWALDDTDGPVVRDNTNFTNTIGGKYLLVNIGEVVVWVPRADKKAGLTPGGFDIPAGEDDVISSDDMTKYTFVADSKEYTIAVTTK